MRCERKSPKGTHSDGVPLLCRVPHSDQMQVQEFMEVSKIASMRARLSANIDVSAIVAGNYFRSSNGGISRLAAKIALNVQSWASENTFFTKGGPPLQILKKIFLRYIQSSMNQKISITAKP